MAINAPKTTAIPELAVVALTRDLPEHNLQAGDQGAVVMVYNNGEAYEVEFVDQEGYTTALLTHPPAARRPVSTKFPL